MISLEYSYGNNVPTFLIFHPNICSEKGIIPPPLPKKYDLGLPLRSDDDVHKPVIIQSSSPPETNLGKKVIWTLK